jgi:hypothetical protein
MAIEPSSATRADAARAQDPDSSRVSSPSADSDKPSAPGPATSSAPEDASATGAGEGNAASAGHHRSIETSPEPSAPSDTTPNATGPASSSTEGSPGVSTLSGHLASNATASAASASAPSSLQSIAIEKATQASSKTGNEPGQQQQQHPDSATPTTTPATRAASTVAPLAAPPLSGLGEETEHTVVWASRLAIDDCLVGNTTCECLSPRVVLAGLAGLPLVCPPENATRAMQGLSTTTTMLSAPVLSVAGGSASIPTFAAHGTRIPLVLPNAAAAIEPSSHASADSRTGAQAELLVDSTRSLSRVDGVATVADGGEQGNASGVVASTSGADTNATNTANGTNHTDASSSSNATSATAAGQTAGNDTEAGVRAVKSAAVGMVTNFGEGGGSVPQADAAHVANETNVAMPSSPNTTNTMPVNATSALNSTNSTNSTPAVHAKAGPPSSANTTKQARGEESVQRLGHQESIFVQLLSRIQVIERELNASETLLGRLSVAYSRLNVSQSVLMANMSSGLTLLNEELAEFSNRSLSIIRSHTELLKAVLNVSDMIVIYLQQTAHAHGVMRDALALQNHLIVACMLLLALLAVGVGYVITLLLRMQPIQRAPSSVVSQSSSASQSAISTPSPSRRSPRQR